MYPFYANVPPPAPPSHHQPRFVSVRPYPPASPRALAVPHHSSLTCDEMIKRKYTDNNKKILDAISRSWFPNPGTRGQCLDFVKHLRVHRNLFMHTYVHLVSCCRSRHLQRLVDNANRWRGWGSVQQLTHHSLIRVNLLSFWADYRHQQCHQHKSLFDQNFVLSEDDSDFLCLLLYCARKPQLYDLPGGHGCNLKESKQVIELLWQFLMTPQEGNVARRLRALIYHIARKTPYLPHALRIPHHSISHKRALGAGGNGVVTMAQVNGKNVAIKKILCRDHATQRKCLELFASEAILWGTLRHKNIVPFLGIVVEGTFDMGLVSTFFRNGNIKNHMKRYNPKDWPALARRWGKDLAEGLAYIHYHEPPIVHGDIKGDNVLVDDAGHALLGDFGQSYASDSRKYLDSTRVGLAASPVHWMAPELMRVGGRAKASDKSDIYAFGCVLYEMMSGKIPFENLPFGSVVKCVCKGERPNRPKSTKRGDSLWGVAKLCWKNRSETRPSAKDIVSFFL